MKAKGDRRPRKSSHAREAERKRWRAFLKPQWARVREILSEREERILSLRLGIVNDLPITLEAIGRRFHINGSTAGQIEIRALSKVKAALKIEGNQ
jgi:DNA-directed RNA polymerase sigma subunit (sigma70/sigma32)